MATHFQAGWPHKWTGRVGILGETAPATLVTEAAMEGPCRSWDGRTKVSAVSSYAQIGKSGGLSDHPVGVW